MRAKLIAVGLVAMMAVQLMPRAGSAAAAIPVPAASSSNSGAVFSTTQTTYVYYNSGTCYGGQWNGYQTVAITSISDTWVRTNTHDQLQSATYNAGNLGHQCSGAVNLQSTGQQTIHPVYSANQASFSRTLNWPVSVLNAADGSAIGHWMKGTVYQDQYLEYGYPCTWVYFAGIFIGCP